MTDVFNDPEEPVQDFPEHGNEDPDDNVFEDRNSDPRDFTEEV
jgi:hypothetical protein